MQPFRSFSSSHLQQMNASMKATIHDSLGICLTSISPEYLEAEMPVDSRTHQPGKLLHGGASAVLAESLGSIASVLIAGQGAQVLGVEISCSHLGAIGQGFVRGRVTPVRIGKRFHVWRIQIVEKDESLLSQGFEKARPICESRLTVFVKQPK